MFHPECHVCLSLLTLNYVQLRNIATCICRTQSLPLPERNKQAYSDVIVRDFRSQTRSFSKTDVESIRVRLQTIDEQNAPHLSRTSFIYKMLEINYGAEVASALRKEP